MNTDYTVYTPAQKYDQHQYTVTVCALNKHNSTAQQKRRLNYTIKILLSAKLSPISETGGAHQHLVIKQQDSPTENVETERSNVNPGNTNFKRQKTEPGRASSNDLAEELPPWLTKISINFINTAHKQINLFATKCKSRLIFYTRSLLFVHPQTVHTKYIYLLILV